jgi:hypothetical protein
MLPDATDSCWSRATFCIGTGSNHFSARKEKKQSLRVAGVSSEHSKGARAKENGMAWT